MDSVRRGRERGLWPSTGGATRRKGYASLLDARGSGHGDEGGSTGRRRSGRPCRARVCASGGR
eukprot:2422588-Pleurochrysis_carterae.AAC.2